MTALSCAVAYTIVGDTPQGTRLLVGPDHPSAPWFLWAYRAADAETWYRDAASCESAARRHRELTTGPYPASTRRELGRLHAGCFP